MNESESLLQRIHLLESKKSSIDSAENVKVFVIVRTELEYLNIEIEDAENSAAVFDAVKSALDIELAELYREYEELQVKKEEIN